MPYVTAEKRLDPSVLQSPKTSGELNYAITRLIERYRRYAGDSYQTFNDIIGVLASVPFQLTFSDFDEVEVDLTEDIVDARQLGDIILSLVHRFGLNNADNLPAYAGVVECAKLEFYRRVVAPFEDLKKELNGDVYRPVEVKP